MTLVLLVESPGDSPEDRRRLSRQFQELTMAGGVQVEADPSAATASSADRLRWIGGELQRRAAGAGKVAVATTGVVVPDGALLRLLGEPAPLAALVASDQPDHRVATASQVVLSASTSCHPVPDSDAGFVGLLVVSGEVLDEAAAVVQRAASSVDRVRPGWDRLDVLDLVLTALVRGGADGLPPVTAVPLEPLPGARIDAPVRRAARWAAVAAIDAGQLAARHAARPGDGFYSTFVLRPISARLTPRAVRRGIRANQVTTVSAVIGVLGAAAFALGAYPALVLGAVLLQLSLVLDCIDGEIARATRTGSAFGAWLDAVTDRVKEYAALAGLALAGSAAGADLWGLALAGMVVQTARHVFDFSFAKGVLAERRAPRPDHRPLSDTTPWERSAGTRPPQRRSPEIWLRRIAHMPIGERWLVLSLGALLDAPRLALAGYLVLSVLAATWTVLGALRRSAGAAAGYSSTLARALAAYRDDGLAALIGRDRAVGPVSPTGPVGRAGRAGRAGPAGGWGGWLLPAALTAAEGAVVLAATAVGAPSWLPAAFAWFAVVAWHRYDLVYRYRGSIPAPPDVVGRLGGGWLVRGAVIVAATALGVLPVVLVAGVLWLTAVYVPESLRTGRRTRHADARTLG